jgi:hypothetical protein
MAECLWAYSGLAYMGAPGLQLSWPGCTGLTPQNVCVDKNVSAYKKLLIFDNLFLGSQTLYQKTVKVKTNQALALCARVPFLASDWRPSWRFMEVWKKWCHLTAPSEMGGCVLPANDLYPRSSSQWETCMGDGRKEEHAGENLDPQNRTGSPPLLETLMKNIYVPRRMYHCICFSRW